MTALLYSPLINELLPSLQNELLENNNYLLSKLLWTLRIMIVEPAPSAYVVFAGLSQAELEKNLAYWNRPIWNRWIPVVRFVLQHITELTDTGMLEFSFIARKWMEQTTGRQLFRQEIALLAMDKLRSRFLEMRSRNERQDSLLAYGEEKDIRENLVNCVLQAADCLPDEVADFVRQNGLRSEDRHRYDFEDVILGEGYGWIPLCKHLPDLAVDILEGILCRKMRPDRHGDLGFDFFDLGISRIRNNNPPTPNKGPFKIFLRLHSVHGLELIRRVVNHSTQIWALRGEKEWNRKPLPQVLKMASGNIEVWGDDQVYHWYRYPSVGPDTITCALMALEKWMNEQIRDGANPKELFEQVLRRTNSVAIVGVCTSVALANINVCLESIVPIIENPVFWEMDIARLTQDLIAETSTKSFSQYFSLGNDKNDYKILIEMAGQQNRKIDIRSFVLPILLNAPQDVRERVQSAIRAFPDNPPLYYEDERGNEQLIKARIDTCRIWAALAERENYKSSVLQDKSGIVIEFELPKELAAERQVEKEALDAQNRFYAFLNWSIAFLRDGQEGPAFDRESAMAYAKELVSLDVPSYRPKDFLESSENRAQAIALFAAALVFHAWEWVEQNQHIAWCTEQLLTAAARPEPPRDWRDEHQKYELGYRRSAARALPVLLSKNPSDVRIRKAILSLSSNHNEEVRAYLFAALRNVWEIDNAFVEECISHTTRQARIRAVHNRYRFLDKNSDYVVRWGKFVSFIKIKARISRLMQVLLAGVYTKPLSKCIYKDVSVGVIQSTLYAIPVDAAITIWASEIHINRLEQLAQFTVNNYLHFQRQDKTNNEWAQYDWNRIFFPILANAILRLQPHQTDKLLSFVIEKWEQVPLMMEQLLRSLSLAGTQPELEQRLIEIWNPLGEKILSSDVVQSPQWSSRRSVHEILGLLIFSDPTGIITWKVDEWKPLRQVTVLIEKWVLKVGDDPECFRSLLRLLSGIGFSLMPDFGIGWLYQCLKRTDESKDLFKRNNITNSLAELLHDSWLKQRQFIEQDQQRFKQFVFLVDETASQGAQVAIRIQSQLQRH